MRYRTLGPSSIRLSELGFGCSRIASLVTSHPRAEIASTLAAAFDSGVNFFDTADIYGQGDSERLLAQVFRGRRDRIVLGTKAGLRLTAPQAAIRWLKPVLSRWLRHSAARGAATNMRRRSERQCFRPGWIRDRLYCSLRRLRTDHVDIFFLHSPPAGLREYDAVLLEVEKLKRAGSVRCFGVSCAKLEDAHYWLDQPGIECLQIPLNSSQLEAADGILLRSAIDGVGIVAREVLGGAGQNVGARVDAATAFARVLGRPEITCALAGMSCRAHMRDNIAAVACVPLTGGAMDKNLQVAP